MPDASFPRRARLLQPADFQSVFKDSKRSVDRYFTVLSRKSNFSHSRLGMAVSKKVDKRAVVRNRVKRQVREYFRQNTIQAGRDLVIIARHAAAHAANDELRSSLQNHWRRLNKGSFHE